MRGMHRVEAHSPFERLHMPTSAAAASGPNHNTNDPVWQAKVHLAAALRLAVLHDFDEGIDNHFTVAVPGRDDQYLIPPFGVHWSEARASTMMVFNEAGETLEGEGVVELSAQSIHAPVHRLTGAKVVLHTHQPWATALNMLKANRLLPATQTAAFFDGVIAYDDHYTGLAAELSEGERLSQLMSGGKTVLFMKNHGVMTVGDTVAQAYRRLYKLEKACRTQVLAMGTGQPLNVLTESVIQRIKNPSPQDRHPRSERERLFFEAMMRVVDRVNPGYAD